MAKVTHTTMELVDETDESYSQAVISRKHVPHTSKLGFWGARADRAQKIDSL